MPLRPPEPDDDAGAQGSTTGSESAALLTSDSIAFLRDLAHVSDQPPDPFEAQLAAAGEKAFADAALLPSSRRFHVRRRLGAGGFGVVYEAFDGERNATVALKALRRKDGRSISRFKNEFRSLVETAHDNLVQLYELHAEGDAWFFTMELVRGTDAMAYLRPPGERCDEARLRAVLLQLAEGLTFLHRSGKLHRDLKPSNVMVTYEGRVVIVDFGLVSDIDDWPSHEGVFGTPAYMAPEQASGQPVGTAADWYAVGVMLYQALTGRLPFGLAEQPRSSLEAVAMLGSSMGALPPQLVAPLLPPSAIAANVPADLDRLCLDLLSPAPELRPTGREVIRRLAPEPRRTETDASASSARREERSAGELPFVGRWAQLAQLRDALAAADAGGTVVVLLQGGSGMGKSALAQRFLTEVCTRAPDRLVLSGRCFEQESVPYKAVDGLIDDLCRHLRERKPAEIAATLPSDFSMLARLFPQLREMRGLRPQTPVERDDDPLLRQRAFAALRELLAQAAPEAPVLMVDDLQWGDLDSIALLTGLLHGQGRAPVLLATSYRAEDAETNPVLLAFFAALGALEGRVELRRVGVGALDDHEAEALSRALLVAGDRAGALVAETTVRALVSEARGDPFLLAELTQHPGFEGAAARAPELAALLAARIDRLPAPARRLLEVVALEGQPVARAIATQAAFGSEGASEALAAISLLRAGRLIRSRRTDEGEEILPYHDRIRERVTQGLDLETSRGHHHRLALAIEATGVAEPSLLLSHYRSAGRLEEAAGYAAEAARRAHEALAYDRAARLYREALALGGSREGAANEGLRVALAEALTGAGRPREAALAYLEAARGAEPADALVRRRHAAELFLGGGYEDEGFETLRAVLHDVDIPLSSSLPRSLISFAALRVRLGVRGLAFRERPESAVDTRELLRVDACYAAALGLLLANPILAAEPQARHLFLALEAGEPFRVARALGLEAVFAAVRSGGGAPVDRLLETARGIERRVAHPQLGGLLTLCEGQVAQVAGQWRRAHELVVESESVLRRRCTGVSLLIDLARFRRTDILWLLGEVAELSRVVPAIVEEARDRGNRFLEMIVQLSTGSLLGLFEGRPDRAKELVAATLERWPRAPGSMLHIRELRAQARIALYEGHAGTALTWIEDGLAAARRTGLILARAQTVEITMLGCLAALSIGDQAGAARYIRAIRRLPFCWAEVMACMLTAGLRRRAGDLGGAVELLGRAREDARGRGEALYDAAISRRLGAWMGGDAGREQIAAADGWMAGQGIVEPERMTAVLLGWV